MVNPEERDLDTTAAQNFGYGNTGSDKMYGTIADDQMWGDTKGSTHTVAAPGMPMAFDKFDTEGGDDWLQGFGGKDLLYGQYGNDKIEGGDGNDSLIGDMGDDKVFGGDGNDVIWGDDKTGTTAPVDNPADFAAAFTPAVTKDSLIEGAYTGLAFGKDKLYGGDGFDIIYGGAGADKIHGGDDDDVLYGEGGEDTIWGDDGADYIDAGYGWDTVFGGDGCDTIVVADGGDVIWLGDCDNSNTATPGTTEEF